MIFIPFPIFLAEIIIFILAVQEWGFLNVVGVYLAPCLLGFVILSFMGRWTLVNLQKNLVQGQMPANSIFHSAAIFVAGVLFLVPSFFARVLAVVLVLPGTRHWAVYKLKHFFKNRMGKPFVSGFSFGNQGGFSGGFKYYDVRQKHGSQNWGYQENSERPVSEANVLDVKPLEIIHEVKKNEDPIS